MARLIDSTLGHKDQISKLLTLRKKNRFPQSVAFVGPSGVGKKRVALAMAQTLVCENSPEACGHCGPCIRIEKQQSESLHILVPDAEAAKPSIKVDAIRELLDSLSLAAAGKARIVIIDSAHMMNDQAANALLKNLEEPSENVYFILIAPEIEQLLPTIRSRVQVMRFYALQYENLRALKPNLPDWAYRSSRGQLTELEVLTSKQGLSERKEALDLFEQFCFNDEFLLFDEWRKPMRDDRQWALFTIRCWLQMVRDAIVIKTDANQFILNTDQAELLKKLSELPAKKLLKFSEQLVQATRDIKGNLDSSLVIDSLKVNYAGMD
jgi:DNA polymerase-3 subunit delta'